MTYPNVIVSDPSWKFGDGLPGKSRGAESNYACLSVPQIVKVIAPHVVNDPNVVMFMWRVSAMQQEALDVLRLLGLTLKSELVWEKLTKSAKLKDGVWTGKAHFGMGRYVRASHEVCLIAVKGVAFPETRSQRSRFAAPVGVHSQKPDTFYEIVEAMYPSSPKTELFARKSRDGWNQDGLELGSIV